MNVLAVRPRSSGLIVSGFLVAILVLHTGCGVTSERRAATVPGAVDWVCFDLRRREPIQSGLDFYGLFLVNGVFIDGVSDVDFDSGAATANVKLQPGIDGEEWVKTLSDEYFDPRIVERWRLSDQECE